MCSEKPICAIPRLSEVSPTLPLERFQCLIDDDALPSFQGRSSTASSFYASLLQAIDGVMSLALCPQVVSQAPQHFKSSETQAACEGCFACQSICSVVSLPAIHPQEFSKVNGDHRHTPVWASHSTFHFF